MKKIFTLLAILILGTTLVACSNKNDEKTINVGVSFYPMDEILDLIKDDLKNDGYNLKYTNFNGDYFLPNKALTNKEFDANMIQHEYFMDAYNAGNNANLVHSMSIYHATFALYSKDNTAVEDIQDNEKIAIPNDPTNLGRALLLLRDAGLITLKDDSITVPKIADIASNPKNLQFEEIALAGIASVYKNDVNYAVMYPTNATSLDLKGDDQRVFVEDIKLERVQKFSISLVVREDNKDSEKITLLKKYLKQDKVRDFIIENYGWASVPAF